eukprot:Colp12_sorted_trinity150504_noHs@3519
MPGDEKVAKNKKGATTSVQLPLARVKKIMKSDPDVNMISQDSLFLVARATELFVEHFAQKAQLNTSKAKRKTVQYKDLSSLPDEYEEFQFLADAIPPPVKASVAFKAVQRTSEETQEEEESKNVENENEEEEEEEEES